MNAADAAARELRAEGLLCRGLTADDPWALAAAAGEFETRIEDDGGDFFARLYLAQALARRFPLSARVSGAFAAAAMALPTADVGAARAELAAHIRESLAASEAHRRQFQPMLDERRVELAAGRLTAEGLPALLALLTESGPEGIDEALAILDTALSRRYDTAIDTFYRAEILRGWESPATVAGLYRAARDALCTGNRSPAAECPRINWRLEQLAAAHPSKGGDR